MQFRTVVKTLVINTKMRYSISLAQHIEQSKFLPGDES